MIAFIIALAFAAGVAVFTYPIFKRHAELVEENRKLWQKNSELWKERDKILQDHGSP